ncbi:hypothetical protein ACFU44_00295 [Nocardia rhizosphaerihabitans]|uniref:hypothetical protein n=1 Tax=Nocardia rhizosphaerihabitans TaxID=1691570 RepID=UPI00366F2E5C
MSFLLRRNNPLAWAGWYDSFQRPPENPIKWPWVHIGDGDKIFINELEELVIPSNFVTSNAGGASYEFEPFTPNWGLEFEFFWPVSGLAIQAIQICLTESWAKVGAQYENISVVRLLHEAAQHSIRVSQFPNPWTSGSDKAVINVSSMSGSTQILRVWFENDEWIRIWLNGNYIGSATLDAGYKAGPTRRCIRISNTSMTGFYIRQLNTYDRPPAVPPKTVWTEIHSDDFERPDGAVGNGWTQFGTDAAIVSGTYAHTGTNNNNVGLLRSTGITSGRVRIEATVGTASAIGSGLLLCCNAAADQSLIASFQSGHVWISRMTSSVNGAPTYVDFHDIGVTVNTGDQVAFSVYNGFAWFEVNGVPKLYSGNVNVVVPVTNQFAGLRVQRSDSNSTPFRDVRIFSGVGF